MDGNPWVFFEEFYSSMSIPCANTAADWSILENMSYSRIFFGLWGGLATKASSVSLIWVTATSWSKAWSRTSLQTLFIATTAYVWSPSWGVRVLWWVLRDCPSNWILTHVLTKCLTNLCGICSSAYSSPLSVMKHFDPSVRVGEWRITRINAWRIVRVVNQTNALACCVRTSRSLVITTDTDIPRMNATGLRIESTLLKGVFRAITSAAVTLT
jgi:hypothetical protein